MQLYTIKDKISEKIATPTSKMFARRGGNANYVVI